MFDLAPQIKDILGALALPCDEKRVEQGAMYFQLLSKWNTVYNFTGVLDPVAMVERHWYDSLTLAPYLSGTNILDVGTGPGLPGIPLSIVFPEKNFCLLDSNERRQLFLEQVVHQLGLSHVTLHCGRVENFVPQVRFDCIISRAFKPLGEMVKLCQHLLSSDGIFLAMKGEMHESELNELDDSVRLLDIISLPNRYSHKPRHAVILKPSKQTS